MTSRCTTAPPNALAMLLCIIVKESPTCWCAQSAQTAQAGTAVICMCLALLLSEAADMPAVGQPDESFNHACCASGGGADTGASGQQPRAAACQLPKTSRHMEAGVVKASRHLIMLVIASAHCC